MGVAREAWRAEPAFDRVFLAEYPSLLRHLAYLTGDRGLAEDLAQDAFRKLLEHDGEMETIREPGAWLKTVASRLAFNRFRDETRRDDRHRRGSELLSESQPGAGTDLEAVLDVRRTLDRLDPRDRAALMLRHSGFSYAEIAEVLGMKTSSVGQTLARAQRRFAELHQPSVDQIHGREGVTDHVSR